MLNGQSPSTFFERVKKQAKNLLTLKKEDKLKVENLSTAQEVMAQVNGYPNWHAFQTHITTAIEEEVAANYPQLKLYPKFGGKPLEIGIDKNGTVNMFIGSVGSGKSTISKEMLWNNMVNRKTPLKTAIITVYPEQRDILQKINHRMEKEVALEVNLKNHHMNLFELPLGFVNYSSEMVYSIFSTLRTVTGRENENYQDIYQGYFYHLIFDRKFIDSVNKPYEKGVCPEIDTLIESGNLLHKNTWKDLSYRLLMARQVPLARKAARLASPVAGDFINFALDNLESSFGTFGSKIDSKSLKIKIWLEDLKKFFTFYKEFSVPTNFDPQSYELLMFSTDDYSLNLQENSVFGFLNSLILNFVKNSFFCKYERETKSGSNDPDFPSYRVIDWENTFEKSMNYTLRSYAFSTFNYDYCSLICDEVGKYAFQDLIIFSRESRKRAILVTGLESSFKESLSPLLQYSGPLIVHSSNLQKEENINQLAKILYDSPDLTRINNDIGWLVFLCDYREIEKVQNQIYEVRLEKK